MQFANNYFLLLPISALIITLLLMVSVRRFSTKPIVITFLVLMSAIAWWSLTAVLEHASLDLSAKILWVKMSYFGIVALPPAWLVFTLQYANSEKWLTRRNLAILTIMPVITLAMVWTNGIFHLMWKDIWLDTSLSPPVDAVTHNIGFWVQAGYGYLLLLSGTVILLDVFLHSSGIYRKQVGIMLLAALAPWVSNFLFIAGVRPFSLIDSTPLAFTITGIAFLWGQARYHLFDVMPIAHEAIFRNTTDGVIVVNAQSRITDLNPAAERMLGLRRADAIGKQYSLALPGQTDFAELKPDTSPTQSTIPIGEGQTLRYYAAYVSPINVKSHLSGHLVMLHDDTERRKAEIESKERVRLETELVERKRAQEALQESEQRYRDLFENSSDLIQSIAPDGHIIYANKAWLELLGYTEAELPLLNLFHIIHPTSLPHCQEVFSRVMAGESVRYIHAIFVAKNGLRVPVEGSATPRIIDGRVVATQGIFHDVTEHQRVEELFRTLANEAPVGVYIVRDGKFSYVNPSFQSFTGYTADELLGRDSLDLVVADDRDTVRENAINMLNGKLSSPYQFRITCKNGDTRWIMESVTSIQYHGKPATLGSYMDITELRQAEEEIKLQKSYLQQLFENSPDAIAMLVETDTGFRFVEVNKSFEMLFGYSNQEVKGQLPTESIVPQDDVEKAEASLQRTLNREVRRNEVKRKRKDGSLVDVSTVGYSIHLGGNVLGLYAIYSDITARKQAEEILNRSTELLKEAQTLGRIGSWEYDMGKGAITWSEETYDLLERDVSLGAPRFWEETNFDPPQRSNVFRDAVNKAIEIRQTLSLDQDIMLPSGKRSYFHLIIQPVINAQGSIVSLHGTVQDITERKQAEEILNKSTGLLKEAQTLGRIGSWEYDIEQGTITWSEETYALLERALSLGPPYLGEESGDNPPQRAKVAWDDINKAIETGQTFSYDRDIMLPSGKRAWFHWIIKPVRDTQGKIVKIHGTIQDITERKQTEETIRVSDEKLRLMFETVTDGIIVTDTDLTITQVNEAAMRMAGYDSKAELIGRKASEFSPEGDRPQFQKVAQRITELGYAKDIEYTVLRKDSSAFPAAIGVNILKDSSGNPMGFVTIVNDITARKKAEEELKRNTELLQEAQTLGRIGSWEYDIEKQTTTWSEETYALLERDVTLGPPDLTGETPHNVIPQYATLIWDDATKAAETGQPFSDDLEIMLPSGKTAYFHVIIQPVRNTQGKIVRIHGTIQDITERKQAEETLRASEEKSRLVFESVTDGIIVTDKDLTVVQVNEAAFRMVGYDSKAEIIGRDGLEFITGIERTRFLEDAQSVMETGYAKDLEYTALRKDGSEFPAEVSGVTLKDSLGNPMGFVTIVKDITERKQMQEQLMLTNRLAFVGELASGIAHELNNPLTSVIGFSQLLMEKHVADDIKEDLSLINSEAQRAASTVKNLLTFARKHAPLKHQNQINNVIEDVLKLRAYEHKVNNIEVERRFASNLPEITVDPFQMQQVFLNIIINAEYFMAEAHKCGRLIITTEKHDDMIRISFTDDGPGISEEDLPRLFSPFFTTKPVGKGTGLGLSICYGIVAEHGGKIYARSELGKGATFVIELPLKVA